MSEKPSNEPEKPDEGGPAADEEDREFAELERGGIDAVLGSFEPNEVAEIEADEPPRRTWRRSPLLSVGVLAIGVYLLVSLWPDFRYWLRSDSAVRDLGQASDILRPDGTFTENFDNQLVSLGGTPDVQHAARLSTRDGYVGYLRIIEGGGSLFAAVPREDERAPDHFDAHFIGRMRQLDRAPAYKWVQQFFDAEDMVSVIDVEAQSFVDALAREGAIVVPTPAGELTLRDDDRIRITVRQPDLMVQLGKKTWPSKAAAEQAIAALGFPFATVDGGSLHHSFLVRAGEDERSRIEATLNAGIDPTGAEADPKVGARVLAPTATYVMAPNEVALVEGGGAIGFRYGENTTSPGYRVEGGKLVERGLDEGRLAVETASLEAVRIERLVDVNPKGYVVLVEELPSGQRLSALLFAVVTGLVLLNAVSLGVGLRRRAAARSAS